MDLAEKIDYWLDIAEYDLKTSGAMLHTSRFLYTVFMAQQALEKLLKALYLKENKEDPPFTHNLLYILKGTSLDCTTEQKEFLNRLTAYYIEGRYPLYKEKLSSLVDKGEATKIFENAKELFSWIKSRIK